MLARLLVLLLYLILCTCWSVFVCMLPNLSFDLLIFFSQQKKPSLVWSLLLSFNFFTNHLMGISMNFKMYFISSCSEKNPQCEKVVLFFHQDPVTKWLNYKMNPDKLQAYLQLFTTVNWKEEGQFVSIWIIMCFPII